MEGGDTAPSSQLHRPRQVQALARAVCAASPGGTKQPSGGVQGPPPTTAPVPTPSSAGGRPDSQEALSTEWLDGSSPNKTNIYSETWQTPRSMGRNPHLQGTTLRRKQYAAPSPRSPRPVPSPVGTPTAPHQLTCRLPTSSQTIPKPSLNTWFQFIPLKNEPSYVVRVTHTADFVCVRNGAHPVRRRNDRLGKVSQPTQRPRLVRHEAPPPTLESTTMRSPSRAGQEPHGL